MAKTDIIAIPEQSALYLFRQTLYGRGSLLNGHSGKRRRDKIREAIALLSSLEGHEFQSACWIVNKVYASGLNGSESET